MPARPQGVYPDGRGGWYFKVTLGSDPLSGKRIQVTKRGYRTAGEAGRERRELLAKVDSGQSRPSSKLITVNELLDLYLDGLDADGAVGLRERLGPPRSPATGRRARSGSALRASGRCCRGGTRRSWG